MRGLIVSEKITARASVCILLCMIILAGLAFSHEIPQFLLDERLFDDTPQYRALIPRDPFLRKLDRNNIIYSHRRDVFDKQDELIAQKKDFMFANLDTMSLDLYQKGELIKTFPIKAHGKEGTFFETPNGLYAIQSKEEEHFSTIGNVWMPWSMHFFGNYFVHGWPYYPDGSPVASTFSGGCIRLSTQDAKELFQYAKNGIPILVYNKEDIEATDASYFQKIIPLTHTQEKANILRNLLADSALAVDFDNGQILFEKQKEDVHPIGSVTKLMTGLVALESIDRFRPLTVQAATDSDPDDRGMLREGDTLKSQDFIYPLILASSNDAAIVYANHVYGFKNLMNQKARAIGLVHTSFKDSTGQSPENISTVQDLFRLIHYISLYKKPLFAISGLARYTIATENKTYTWENTTWPRADGIFIGGKAGLTPDNRHALAAVFTVHVSEQGNRSIAIILLGSADITQDVQIIRKYLEDNFVYGNILTKKNAGAPSRIINTGANVFEALRTYILKP